MSPYEIKKLRKLHNEKLIELMKQGFSCNFVKPESTWFPPRPIIKKDPKAIQKLYGIDTNSLTEN